MRTASITHLQPSHEYGSEWVRHVDPLLQSRSSASGFFSQCFFSIRICTNWCRKLNNGGNGPIPNGIFGGSVDLSTGNLTNVTRSPFATTQFPSFGTVEPSQGRFLIGLITPPPYPFPLQLASYSIDSSTGSLSQVSGAGTSVPGRYPQKMVVVAPTH